MTSKTYNLTRYDADPEKVFDWVEPRFIDDAEGNKIQEHLYAKTLFIGAHDNINNYIEIDAPIEEE